jgi:hypothetical protein
MPHKIKPVEIVHPDGMESVVDAPSVTHWERAGWKRKDVPTADLKKTAPRRESKEG